MDYILLFTFCCIHQTLQIFILWLPIVITCIYVLISAIFFIFQLSHKCCNKICEQICGQIRIPAVEDIFVFALRARRIVAIVKLRILNNLTYLLTYLLTWYQNDLSSWVALTSRGVHVGQGLRSGVHFIFPAYAQRMSGQIFHSLSPSRCHPISQSINSFASIHHRIL